MDSGAEFCDRYLALLFALPTVTRRSALGYEMYFFGQFRGSEAAVSNLIQKQLVRRAHMRGTRPSVSEISWSVAVGEKEDLKGSRSLLCHLKYCGLKGIKIDNLQEYRRGAENKAKERAARPNEMKLRRAGELGAEVARR